MPLLIVPVVRTRMYCNCCLFDADGMGSGSGEQSDTSTRTEEFYDRFQHMSLTRGALSSGAHSLFNRHLISRALTPFSNELNTRFFRVV